MQGQEAILTAFVEECAGLLLMDDNGSSIFEG
jgi:hypothetical protein